MSSRSHTFTPPRQVSWLIALIPIFPPFYLAALAALGHLRVLPLTARYLLFFFASTQLVAALFTPRPLLSLGLAAVRTLLILAMIAAGVYLRESRHLRPLLWGQLVIFGTAWGYTLLTQGWAGVQNRLGHPYYYVVSLGLVAVVALWITVFWRGGGWWRWPAGGVAVVTFLAAGSRGAALALTVGSVAALAFGGRGRRWWVLLPAALVLGVAALTSSLNLPFKPIERLLNDQTSGREYVWADAYAAWQTSPLGGVGAFQGGRYLTYLYKDGCQLTPTLEANQVTCPAWLEKLSSVWLIAHNAWLHWLMETGVIGLAGLVTIYGYGFWAVTRSRDPLLIALLFGYTAMNMVDVVVALPSQHFAELWWAVVGMGLVYQQQGQKEGYDD